jgi:hypothetical protein
MGLFGQCIACARSGFRLLVERDVPHHVSLDVHRGADVFDTPPGRPRIIVRRVIVLVAPGKCCGACQPGSLAASRRTRGGSAT